MTNTPVLDDERTELLDALAKHRGFLLHTVDGLTAEQARLRPTASALCLGGLVKHVTRVEARWVDFIVRGAAAMAMTESSYAEHAASFEVLDGESLADIVGEYEKVAQRSAFVVVALPDLAMTRPLPEAPWFEPGAAWSARRALVHIIAETAQHAGHADIIRETIDGQRTMG
jgi:hypothetical protein